MVKTENLRLGCWVRVRGPGLGFGGSIIKKDREIDRSIDR